MKKLSFIVLFVATLVSFLVPIAQADNRPFAPYLWTRDGATPFFRFEMGIDGQIGQVLDCLVIAPDPGGSHVEEGRIFWVYPGTEDTHYWFRKSDLVGDPRETEWWQKSLREDKGKTLWSRVARAAKTEAHPGLTKAIINDMVKAGVTTQKEIRARKMTTDRLTEIMVAYSDIVED
jgi:cytosine/adenosine deaminase-related metal-dependent hydrolase